MIAFKHSRIRALGCLDWRLVIGCGEGGGLHVFYPSGYVLLECNLTGLVSCSDISGILVRLRFVRLRVAARMSLNVT